MADSTTELGVQQEAGPSSLPDDNLPCPSLPATRPANSLLSYFGNGNGNGPSRPSPMGPTGSTAGSTAPGAKPKRSKAVAPDQARLGTTSASGVGSSSKSGWTLEKTKVKEAGDEVKAKPKARKKAARVDEGEEAERKEMAKRAKVEKSKGKGKGKGKETSAMGNGELDEGHEAIQKGSAEPARGQDVAMAARVDQIQSKASGSQPPGPIKPIPPGPRISDTKRKRSHHHPQQRAQAFLPASTQSLASSQVDSPRSTPGLTSSPPTITLSSSTESSDDDRPKPEKAVKLPRAPAHPTHPLFSRSNSAMSKGASQEDAIDIDDSPKRPRPSDVIDLADSPQAKPVPGPGWAPGHGAKKTAFPAEKKGVHGFFGMKRAALVAPASVEGSMESQAKGATPIPKPPKDKVHSFFQAGPKGVPGQLGDGWGGDRKMGEEWLAPFPARKWPSHVGCSDLPVGPPGILRKRRKYSVPLADPLSTFFSDLEQRRPPSSSSRYATSTSTLSTPMPLADHPAVRSITHRSRESDQETWCERYRPMAAAQVLGNENEATYLRDWLQLLSVDQDSSGPGSTSTAKVTRRVPGKRPQLLDGWIVDDINDFDDDGQDPTEADPDQPDFEAFEFPPSAIDARPDTYPSFGERLANTILLTGPHGSGKTAAVYAVAEELGWEVFEVYPGIGKRTGGNLMSLVGDVGRNHVIAGKGKGKVTPKKAKATSGQDLNNGAGTKPRSAAGSFFKNVAVASAAVAAPVVKAASMTVASKIVPRKRANQLPPSSQGSQDDPMRLDDSDDDEETPKILLPKPNGGVDGPEPEPEILEDRKHGFRETLILLDEADLLFEEEASFWPSVISLIAESRRPIVITCNDPEQIPIRSLPLQAMLEFEAPSRALATSLLSAIAAHENLPLSHESIAEAYEAAVSGPLDLLDQPTPIVPNGHEPIPMFDLRRAITQMQLDRSKCGAPIPPEQTGEMDDLGMEAMYKGLEATSFVDAWIGPRPWAVREVSEIDRYAASQDDLLGVHHLLKPEVHPDRPILAACSAEQGIADYVLSLVPSTLNTCYSGDLGVKQTMHMRALLPLLDPLIPLNSNLLPHYSLFTEYFPTLRSMVLADDIMEMAEEAALASGGERVNRKTGRPIRTVTGWLKGKEEGGYVRYLKEAGKDGEAVVRDIRLSGGCET